MVTISILILKHYSSIDRKHAHIFVFLLKHLTGLLVMPAFSLVPVYRTKSKIFIACKCYGWHIFFFFFFFQVKDEIQWMNVCILYYSLLKVIPVYPSFRSSGGDFNQTVNKGNNKTTELRTIPQRESQNSQLYKQTKSVNNRKTVKTVMTLTWYRHLQRNGGLNQTSRRQTSRSHYGSKVPAVTVTVFKYRNKIGKIVVKAVPYSVT